MKCVTNKPSINPTERKVKNQKHERDMPKHLKKKCMLNLQSMIEVEDHSFKLQIKFSLERQVKKYNFMFSRQQVHQIIGSNNAYTFNTEDRSFKQREKENS